MQLQEQRFSSKQHSELAQNEKNNNNNNNKTMIPYLPILVFVFDFHSVFLFAAISESLLNTSQQPPF